MLPFFSGNESLLREGGGREGGSEGGREGGREGLFPSSISTFSTLFFLARLAQSMSGA